MLVECLLLSVSLCKAVRSRPIVTLASAQTAALVMDGMTTARFAKLGYPEVDPVARIFIGTRPTWYRMAPTGVALVTAQMWLAYRLKTSHHWERHIWWLPLVIGTAANTYEAVHNTRHRSPQTLACGNTCLALP